MATKTKVSAATVRAWGRDNLDLIPEGARAGLRVPAEGENGPRGRVHPLIIAAYTKANKGKTYETGAAEAPVVQVPKFNSKGHRTGRTESVLRSEVRSLDFVNAKGRIPEAVLINVGRVRAGLDAL